MPFLIKITHYAINVSFFSCMTSLISIFLLCTNNLLAILMPWTQNKYHELNIKLYIENCKTTLNITCYIYNSYEFETMQTDFQKPAFILNRSLQPSPLIHSHLWKTIWTPISYCTFCTPNSHTNHETTVRHLNNLVTIPSSSDINSIM